MSSFIGHSLSALTIHSFAEPRLSPIARKIWLGWIGVLAIAPDVDYAIYALRIGAHHDIRITHSFLGVVFLPLMTVGFLVLAGYRGSTLKVMSMQAGISGLSHLLLDVLVGVTDHPLFWPISSQGFGLPFGILPSAPALSLTNVYLYLNLSIEIGVLVPLFSALIMLHRSLFNSLAQKVLILCFLGISFVFMFLAYNLGR